MEECNTAPWVFFAFFKSYKWYQIAERTTNATMEILLLEELVSKIKTNVLYSTTSLLNFLQLTSWWYIYLLDSNIKKLYRL